ncbi:MAG: choice-of-anchor Q domain-containing protein [Phycisphaerales bacterium]
MKMFGSFNSDGDALPSGMRPTTGSGHGLNNGASSRLAMLLGRNGVAAGLLKGRRFSRFECEALEARQLLATFTVTSLADSGMGSLRQAVTDANSLAGADVITFDASAHGAITLSGTELVLAGELTIEGPGASELSVSGNLVSRVFRVLPDASVSISGLAISNGYSANSGGGVYNDGSLAITNCTLSGSWSQNGGAVYNAGVLTITNSSLASNTAQYGGGGIKNTGTLAITSSSITGNSTQDISYGSGGGIDNTSTLTITNSTISGNASIEYGGGIYAWGGSLTIINTTISGNSSWYGGGIFASRTLTITNSTISSNTSQPGGQGGGLFLNTLEPMTVRNSTIAGNLGNGGIHIADGALVMLSSLVAGNAGGDFLGDALGAGSFNNLVQDAAHAGGISNGVNANLVGVDPLLSALADNGGPTKTMGLQAGSPALGTGLNPANLTSDQRGGPFARGTSVDIGAYQRQSLALVVDTNSDAVDGNYSAGNLSLREAIDACNANPLADAITFASALNATTITLGGSELLVFGDLTITGPSQNALSISGNTATRVFEIASSASVSISKLTIKDGHSASLAGGVYINANATLNLVEVALSGNTSSGGAGGINNDGTLTITNSTISGNTASSSHGGGINNTGTLTITGSTISQNTAQSPYSGGGVNNFGQLTIASSTIYGNTALYGGGVNNSGGTFTITNTNILQNSAPGANGGAVHNYGNGTGTITNCTISGNSAELGAGVMNDSSTLTISGSAISGNTANAEGGGVYNNSLLTITNSIISGNTAVSRGGGVHASDGTLTLTNSTVTGDSAPYGGGIAIVNGALIVTNCTISANTASVQGGGLYAIGASPTIRNSTIGANLGSGGIFVDQSFPLLISCIVAGNTGGDILNGGLSAGSINNLVQDAAHAGGLTNGVDANIVGADPLLSALADNGGPTKTMALAAGSPAIGKGLNPANLTTDQRGGPFARGASVDIGAYQRQSFAFVVDSAVDESDGDFGAGDLSLREAIEAAGPNPGNDTITFAASLNGQMITLGGTELTAKGDLTITGPGASVLSISGNNASRVFQIVGGANVAISGLTITNGYNAGGGGGFYNQGTLTITDSTISESTGYSGGGVLNKGTLTITGSTISGNPAAYGGGIYNNGTVTITDSTISANSALYGGGVDSTAGTTSIINSTISGNSAQYNGGGLYNYYCTLAVTNSTIWGNSAPTAGGGIGTSGGTVTLRNTTIAANLGNGGLHIDGGAPVLVSCIVAGNASGDIMKGTLGAASTNNLIQDAAHAGGLTNGVNANIVGVDPLLSALADNGGTTTTMALASNSPAISKGLNPANLTTDQRGQARVRGTAIDIGAFEFSANPTLASLGASGSTIVRGQSMTLTANSVTDADGTIARVDFYRDANNNGVADSGELIGSDSNPAGGYTLSVAVPTSAALGAQSYLAVAVDNDGGLSSFKSASVTIVNAVPTIASLTPSATTLENGDPLTLTAKSVADADGTIVKVSFYADTNKNGVADANELLGAGTSSAGGFAYTLTPAQTFALPSASVTFLAVAADNNSGVSTPRSGNATLLLSAADRFIQTYLAAPKDADGLVDGDAIVATLKSTVSNVATSDAYWGAQNHWFQDKKGDVWVLWQGGDAHKSTTLPGQHRWVLTNLTEAAGLSGTMRFAPGSLSGITTGWNAFNVQGIQDGKLMALWWSPEASAETYVDLDGTLKHGKALGLRGNGWSLSSISDALVKINGAVATPPGLFRAYSMSQGNSRTDFDPRTTIYTANNGMSVVLVDTSNHVYLATFNVWQQLYVDGARNDLNGQWLIERMSDVPSFKWFGLEAQEPAFEQQFIAAANH